MSFSRKRESSIFALDPCFRRGDIVSFCFPQQIQAKQYDNLEPMRHKSIGKLVVFGSEAAAAMRLCIAAYLGVVLLRGLNLSYERISAGTSKMC
ncbi:MAG: hypothetical protein CEE38_02920 [Planctomycetes bacterium B3_Pla]|nr:MAG: hypothetical protein CEE38_02920 [Planctomycetes bacterium B3_Pla]